MTNETTNGRIGEVDLARARELKVGDRVAVLNACRLPQVEDVRGFGVIESKTVGSYPLFFVSGFPCGRTADVLRLIRCAVCGESVGTYESCPHCGYGS